jgi:hypothetical protein
MLCAIIASSKRGFSWLVLVHVSAHLRTRSNIPELSASRPKTVSYAFWLLRDPISWPVLSVLVNLHHKQIPYLANKRLRYERRGTFRVITLQYVNQRTNWFRPPSRLSAKEAHCLISDIQRDFEIFVLPSHFFKYNTVKSTIHSRKVYTASPVYSHSEE